MGILTKFFQLKKIFLDRALLISYKKIDDLPNVKAGYIDIDVVAKRYRESAKNVSYLQLLNQQSVKDNFYFLEEECKEYFNRVRSGTKLLDIGCGSGVYSKVFKRTGKPFENISYYGTEIDKKITDVCKQYNPGCNFIVSYADKISAEKNSFDVVFCSSTLHYTLKKWKRSIREMVRVTKKYLILSRFPVSKYNDTFYVHQTVRGINGVENHYFIVINRSVLEKYFIDLGLEILKRDYSSEEYNIDGVSEKIILVQYLLQKNEN